MKKKIDLRRAIKARGFTIRDVAKKMGVQPPTIIQNMINGNPTVKKLEELADCLDCDITELFFPVEEEAPQTDTSAPSDGLFSAANSTEQTTEQTAEAQADTKTPVQGADAVPQDAREMMYCPHCGTKFFVAHVPHA